MYEHISKPLISRKKFFKRMLGNIALAFGIMVASLAIGVFGYHIFADLGYVDSFLNASMILGGMGPVDMLKNDTSKIFAGIYALFSGITFLSTFAILLSPVVHRFVHKMHAANDEDETKEEDEEDGDKPKKATNKSGSQKTKKK